MALARVELQTLVSDQDALTTEPPPSDTYQEGSSDWEYRKDRVFIEGAEL